MTETTSQHHPDALPIGTALGDFAITGLIGEGGFGIVYLAYEATLDRTVAIKEYLPVTIAARTSELTVAVRSQNNRDAYNAGLQSFLREARMQARFSHPAMLEVYRVWEQNGTAYMAMRYYPGNTLRNLRKAATTSSAFDETAIQRIMMPVFDALTELHSQSVLHRDVSPDNILIMPSGAPVLLDFGAARSVVAGAAQSLTTVLKPGYAPIEQYADDGTMVQGPWTDVYGLGAVLYFLAMGTPPPQAVTRLMGDSLRAFEDSASALYSPTFIDAVKRALAVRPETRLQSVEALRETLGWSWARASDALQTHIVAPTTISAPAEVETPAAIAPAPTTPAPRTKPATEQAPKTQPAVPAVATEANREEAAAPSSKSRTGMFIGVAVALLALAGAFFIFKPSTPPVVSTPAEPKSASQPASTTAPVVADPKPEPVVPKAEPSEQPVVNAPATSPAKAQTPPAAKPAAKASAAAEKSVPAVPAATAEEEKPAPAAVKPTRPARSPIDPVELRDSGFNGEVASKPREAVRTAPEVCERLLAKLSLGTDELTATERTQLRTCR